MKETTHAIAAALLLAVCITGTAKGSTCTDEQIPDYTGNATAIEEKKQEMLEIADYEGHFWFSDDTEFQSQDPHAYWLMNRMMQMVQLVKTADDDWAWMLAMNESIKEYNSRLGRKIGSVNAAAIAIEELIDIYNAGNQPMLNTASYVTSILAHYKAVNEYYELIEYIYPDSSTEWDERMRELYYHEFKTWYGIIDAQNALMYGYTFAPARYSALPMDLNGKFETWTKARQAELKTEKEIIYPGTPSTIEAKETPAKELDNTVKFFQEMNKESVEKAAKEEWSDDEFALELIEGRFDYEDIVKMANSYVESLADWRNTREKIAKTYPQQNQKDAIREITKNIHTRLYKELSELKELVF